MATKQRDMTDSMHYESRQIRDALATSNARLKSARSGRVPADLQPQLGAIILQEWEGLCGTGHLDEGDTLASSNPLYQQMRSALLSFESEVGYAAPARERAFFSALRTQLMDAGALRDEEQRDMQLAATYKWFSRHKPQGQEADPVTAAVLASSLAVEANAAPVPPDPRGGSVVGTPSSYTGAQPPQFGSSSPPPLTVVPSAEGASAAAMPGPYGKHYFFDVYSRAPICGGGGSSGGTGPGPVGDGSAATAVLRPMSAHRRPSPVAAAGRPTGRVAEEPPSLSMNHPLGMYPAVYSSGGAARNGAVGTPAATEKASAAAAGGGGAPPRARFASTEVYAPAKLIRPQELDDLDHRAAQVAAAAAAAGVSRGSADGGGSSSHSVYHSKPWVSGPHKPSLGPGPPALTGGGAGVGRGMVSTVRHSTKPPLEEMEEVEVLRSKWSAMELKTNKSVTDVQAKVAEWTLQRARLEEEIVRRQEAGRIAPLNGSLGGSAPGAMPWQIDALRRSDYDDAGLAAGSLSPYANANADLAAATAAATGPGSMGLMMSQGTNLPGGSAVALGASMRQRHADVASYDRSRGELMTRLTNLGVTVSGEALDRALRPLEDRPFLDCIARLPRPGEHLVSRPGSVRLPAAKKKRSKSAGKKRPTSGAR